MSIADVGAIRYLHSEYATACCLATLSYSYAPLLPGVQAVAGWLASASLLGGAWNLFDRWILGRVDRVPWNTISYGWPTAMVLAWPLFRLAEQQQRGTFLNESLELLLTIYGQ